MKNYKIKCDDQIFEMMCDHAVVNEDGHLELFIDTHKEGCFCDWDYYYQILPYDSVEQARQRVEEAKKYFQGFSYEPPKFKSQEEQAISKVVDALKELYDASNPQ